MADSPYLPSRPTAKDRVRGLTGDKASPFRFHDEEIAYELAQAGFAGDPLEGEAQDPTPSQPLPEIEAAISLLQTSATVTGTEQTIKTLSVTRTIKGATSGGYDAILKGLIARRNALLNLGSGIAVVQCAYPELSASCGYPDPSAGC